MCQSVGAAGFAASTATGVAAVGMGIGGLVGGLPENLEKESRKGRRSSRHTRFEEFAEWQVLYDAVRFSLLKWHFPILDQE